MFENKFNDKIIELATHAKTVAPTTNLVKMPQIYTKVLKIDYFN